MPGHPSPHHPEFDHREQAIIAAIRAASYKINKEKVPGAYPTPPAPGRPFSLGPGRGAVAFAGSAWAQGYEVQVVADGEVVSTFNCDDSTKEGEFGVSIGCGRWAVRVRAVGVGGGVSEWSEEGEVAC